MVKIFSPAVFTYFPVIGSGKNVHFENFGIFGNFGQSNGSKASAHACMGKCAMVRCRGEGQKKRPKMGFYIGKLGVKYLM
jgi:hypothetical protein